MLLREVNYGDVVYCGYNGQTYMVEGWDSNRNAYFLKNLTNLESPPVSIPPSQLREYPDNWALDDYYRTMAKNIVDSRKKV